MAGDEGFLVTAYSNAGQFDCEILRMGYDDIMLMRQYRPTIEQLKLRYSQEMARRKMIERRHAANPNLAKGPKIPSNSEPWLPHAPRNLADCIWISQQVGDRVEQWKSAFSPTTLSEN